jgi:hypothetical protein
MDLVISGGEDTLLESLNFSLPPSTSYVQQRRLVSYYPSGASTFSPSGVRVVRYNLNGDWLDPASMRIYGKIYNSGAGVLQLASGPHCLFSRIRLFIGGTLCEDLDYYGRSHELLRRILMPADWCQLDSVESGLESANGNGLSQQQLAPGKTAMFNMQPLLGLLNCGKMLPLRLSGGISIELTLADITDSCVVGTSYELQEMSVRCATSKLDSALESTFNSMLMSNKALTLRINTYHTQSQSLPAGNSDLSISLVRAFSRLNALFISFQGSDAADTPPANKQHTRSFLNPSSFIVGGVHGSKRMTKL